MGLFDWLLKLTGYGPQQPPQDAPARERAQAQSSPLPPAQMSNAEFQGSSESSEKQSVAPPRPSTLGLDAGDYLPIGREELKQGAQQNQAWGNPWFGRRDLIPPATDPRTKLIDRGLVTN